MRLFFKHLLRSMRKKPIQPVVLIFTIAISVAVSIFSFTIRSMMHEEIDGNKNTRFGNADFTISLSGVSSSRFMSADRVEELIGDRGRAVGCFELAAVSESDGRTVICNATRLDRISEFFDFRFTSLIPISPATEAESAFISADFASRYSLDIGDSFEIYIGGMMREYRVCGISELRFMSDADILVDITGVIRTITSGNPIFSALGDSFEPSSIIYVDAEDGQIQECMRILGESNEFSDKSIVATYDQLGDEKNRMAVSAPMEVSILLTALLTAAVVFTCLYILSVERTEENDIFIAVGAKTSMMAMSQYFEIFIYWLIGGALGLVITIPLLSRVVSFAGYEYATGRLSASNVLFSEIGILLTSFATVAVFTLGRKARTTGNYHRDKGSKLALLMILVYVITVALTFVMPENLIFPCYILSVIFVVAVSLMTTPHVLSYITKLLGNRSDRRLLTSDKSSGIALRYASKNLGSVVILKNTARLFSVIFTVLMSLIVVILSYFGFIKSSESVLCGDYAVINSSESCYNILLECDGVESLSRVYTSREKLENDMYVNVIATDNSVILNDAYSTGNLPEGNQAIISASNAKMMSLDIGDSFTVNIGGREIELVVSDICNSSVQLLIFDAEHFDIAYNMLIVNGDKAVSKNYLYEQITSATTLEMAAVISVDQMLQDNVRVARILLRATIFVLAVACLFMLVAMINNLIESYRFRREEFELYRISGMSRRDIRRMKALELTITFGVGGFVGLVLFVVSLIATQKALIIFGMDTFRGFKDWILL